jgi:hypothetical protein
MATRGKARSQASVSRQSGGLPVCSAVAEWRGVAEQASCRGHSTGAWISVLHRRPGSRRPGNRSDSSGLYAVVASDDRYRAADLERTGR